MGRQAKQINGEQVKKLASYQCTNIEIASVMECSTKTLERRFSDEIAAGRNLGKATLRRKQWDLAMAGDRAMLIWLGKQMLGQTERQEVTGKDGAPLTFVEIADRVFPQD